MPIIILPLIIPPPPITSTTLGGQIVFTINLDGGAICPLIKNKTHVCTTSTACDASCMRAKHTCVQHRSVNMRGWWIEWVKHGGSECCPENTKSGLQNIS